VIYLLNFKVHFGHQHLAHGHHVRRPHGNGNGGRRMARDVIAICVDEQRNPINCETGSMAQREFYQKIQKVQQRRQSTMGLFVVISNGIAYWIFVEILAILFS
jgi:hypothetical protein